MRELCPQDAGQELATTAPSSWTCPAEGAWPLPGALAHWQVRYPVAPVRAPVRITAGCRPLRTSCQRAYHAAFVAAGLYPRGTNPARLTADRATLPMESAWSNGRPAYWCSHGHTIATAPDAGRAKNACAREDAIVPHLPALHLLLTGPVGQRKRRTRGGIDIRTQATPRT